MSKSRLRNSTVKVGDTEWRIRELTYAERNEFIRRAKEDAPSVPPYVAWRCTLNEDGSSFFASEKEPLEESAAALDAISQGVMKLSGMGEQETEEKKG